MARVLFYVAIVGLLVGGAVWMADRPGEVVIRWQGWRVDTTVPVLLLAIVAAVASLGSVVRLVRFVTGAPKRFLAGRRDKRTREGYRALSDGMAAVAAGDPRRAKKLAKRADKLLADPSLTRLLTAQAAGIAGNRDEARRRLEDMAADSGSAFLGWKGLMEMAIEDGDHVRALDCAARAFALNPAAEGMAAALFDLQVRAGLWNQAEETLAEAERRKALKVAELRRRRALILAERARLAEEEGDGARALELALKAHDADGSLAAPALRAARLLTGAGKQRKAAALLETAWKTAPHPAIAEAWAALAPNEAPLERVKRMEKLLKLDADAPDGHLALADAALAARLWGQARTHLEKAAAARPGRAVFARLARLEREELGDEAAAALWLEKGAAAPADPAWTCTACAAKAPDWSPACPACGAVDTLTWKA